MSRCSFGAMISAVTGVTVLWLAAGAGATAQVLDTGAPVFTRQAIARAVSQDTAPIVPQDPRTDWFRLQRFTNQEILLFAQGMAGRKGQLVSADDTALTVVDLESSRGGTLVIPKGGCQRDQTADVGGMVGYRLFGERQATTIYLKP